MQQQNKTASGCREVCFAPTLPGSYTVICKAFQLLLLIILCSERGKKDHRNLRMIGAVACRRCCRCNGRALCGDARVGSGSGSGSGSGDGGRCRRCRGSCCILFRDVVPTARLSSFANVARPPIIEPPAGNDAAQHSTAQEESHPSKRV